jgi:hypothetical protein
MAIRSVFPDDSHLPCPAPDRHGDPAAPAPARRDPAARGAVRRLRLELERRAATAARASVEDAALFRRAESTGDVGEDDASDPLVELREQLHALTTRAVCRVRAEGVGPEQMLVRVKACVRELLAAEGWHDPQVRQVLTAHVVGWSIDAYYDR